MIKTIQCFLKRGKSKPLEGRHPWIFSGAIDRIDEGYQAGDLVRVFSHDKQFLGVGYLNPSSQITIRMLTFKDATIDENFFAVRIREALDLRQRMVPSDTSAYRVVHSEGDGIPGLIADRYGDYLVVQFLTAGIEPWREVVVSHLQEGLSVRGVFEKSDSELREREGLERRVGVLAGEALPEVVEIREHGVPFYVNVVEGQKTGFYLDQRENRNLIRAQSRGKAVLNGFAYTGAFAVCAALGGAIKTISVDSSESARRIAEKNFQKNEMKDTDHHWVKADVFQYLRSCRQKFDLVILDPPAFCKNKQQIQQAARGYKDINLYGMKLLNPKGLLLTCSCSSFISPDLFWKIVHGAAKDAGKRLRILARTAHNFDHPISLDHPEGEYLKGLLCQVVGED